MYFHHAAQQLHVFSRVYTSLNFTGPGQTVLIVRDLHQPMGEMFPRKGQIAPMTICVNQSELWRMHSSFLKL